jgi:TatD DNase family protein
MPLFDTHAHLADEQLASDFDGVLSRARAAGVEEILAVGTTLESSRACIALAERHEGIYASAGIHPNHAAEAGENDWNEIVVLARAGHVKALGETGLDKHWNDTPFPMQQDYFDRHLSLSQETGLPFIVHMRECGEDVLAMLVEARRRGPLSGVMHSFTGDAALATECLSLGLYVSFAGMVTYKKSEELRQVAKEIPADRILVETDSPYLSPEPHRGKRPNEPARVANNAECLAIVRGVGPTDFAEQTTANARRWLRIDE